MNTTCAAITLKDSVVMWFNEHNHPVDYEKLTPEERKKAHRERCYKLVSILHRILKCFHDLSDFSSRCC